MHEERNDKNSDVKSSTTIKIPLTEPIKALITKEVGDKAPTVVNIIEAIVETSNGDNLYSELIQALTPMLEDKVKSLVGKIFVYKKKPCREGKNCKNKYCIFLHENERKRLAENRAPQKNKKFDDNKDSNLTSHKRARHDDLVDNSEVIFNKVNETKHTVNDLRDYASKFGSVVELRRLNPEKYLIIFENVYSSNKLIKSPDFVLGDPSIKKFFNVMDNLVKVELKKLFDEQETLIGRMLTSQSLNLLSQLKNVNFKIKNIVMKDKTRQNNNNNSNLNINDHTNNSNENKNEYNQEQSLYFNCF